MSIMRFEFLVEDRSTETFLSAVLTKILHPDSVIRIHSFQGKRDLLAKLSARLRGYARSIDETTTRIVVVVDRDSQDCHELKKFLEAAAHDADLTTPSASQSTWTVLNRIAVEELEAWYFGEWESVVQAYPDVPANIPRKAKYRNSDVITNTWESFERILQRHGYFQTGLRKVQAAAAIGANFDPDKCSSPSFRCLLEGLRGAQSISQL